MVNGFAVDELADLFLNHIERGDNAQPAAGKLCVAEERGCQAPGAYNDGFVVTVPVEEAVDGIYELLNREANTGLADDAGNREVFSHLYGLEIELIGYDRSGDELPAFPLSVLYDVKVRWESFDCREARELGSLHFVAIIPDEL